MITAPQLWLPGINRAHPLAQGVRHSWPMWAGAGQGVMDVVGENDGTIGDDAPWDGEGVLTGPEGTTTATIDVGKPPMFTDGKLTEFTFLCIAEAHFAIADIAPNEKTVVSNWDNASSDQLWLLRVDVDDGGTLHGFLEASTDQDDTLIIGEIKGEKHAFGVRWRNNVWQVIFDHNMSGGVAATAPVATVNVNNTLIGGSPHNDGDTWIGIFEVATLWDVGLSDRMIRAWLADPWAIHRPPEFLPHVAAAGGLPIPVAHRHYRQQAEA